MNIKQTTDWNLCCGCGVCVGICPKQCIAWERENGMYQPRIETAKCVSCGLCAKVCPGLGHKYAKNEAKTAVIGTVLHTHNAWSRDDDLRFVSASGGVVSTMTRELLLKRQYDTAFVVGDYCCDRQLCTQPVTAVDLEHAAQTKFPKSRYLPVSHENAVRYIRKNREKKVIFVGTSCAIRALCAAIEQLRLPREQYLMIGLFCDSVFAYSALNFFSSEAFCGTKKLTELHFKNKESGGWPGNMKFFFSDGSTAYQNKREREKAKEYFMPERCLYCIDKLNISADISVGDNYTGVDSSERGSNSVLIRTERGSAAWNCVQERLELREITVEQIAKAQALDWRLNRLMYAKIREKEINRSKETSIMLNAGVQTERNIKTYDASRKILLKKLKIGEQYAENQDKMQKKKEKLEKRLTRSEKRLTLHRIYRDIKRKIFSK